MKRKEIVDEYICDCCGGEIKMINEWRVVDAA